jgi:hypothetical protein
MKTIYDRITKIGQEYRVTLTDLQESALGKLLHQLYYGRSDALCDLAPNRTGFPHNGGQHTFTMRGKKDDLVAYLELLEETFKGYWWSEQSLKAVGAVKKALIEA